MDQVLAQAAIPQPLTGNEIAMREESVAFLRSLLNQILIVHTTDGRLFRGQFMCTDPDYNIVLSHTDEYRHPTARQVAEQARQAERAGNQSKVVVNMVSRYLGLVVVPGKHIVKIEVEQYLSQMGRG